MAAGAALAWGARAVPLWMQRLSKWAGGPGGVGRRNPFTGPRKIGRTKREPAIPIPLKDARAAVPSRPIMDKGGLFYRNPRASFWAATLGGPAAAGTAYGLLSGDDEPAEGVKTSTGETVAEYDQRTKQEAQQKAANAALEKNQPSMSAGHREAYLKRRKKRLKKGMKQLLNQYMILSYVSPKEADNFLKAGMKMMEKDQEFNDDLEIQDAYDTVFQPGNMPTSGRDAFARLSPLVGRKEAMEIAGEWGDLVPEYKEWQYKKKEDMKMGDILRMPRDQAIKALISAWASNTFDTPENLKMVDPRSPAGEQEWVAYADAYLNMMQSGGGTAESSGQILSDTKAS